MHFSYHHLCSLYIHVYPVDPLCSVYYHKDITFTLKIRIAFAIKSSWNIYGEHYLEHIHLCEVGGGSEYWRVVVDQSLLLLTL